MAYASGEVQRAFSFDGTNDYIEAPDSASLSITGAITVDAWINPDEVMLSDGRVIVSKRAGSSTSYIFMIVAGKLRFQVNGASTFRYADSTSTISTGVFTHVAATFDPISQAIKLYINGIDDLAPIGAGSGTVSSIVDNAAPFRIGVYDIGPPEGLNAFFDGLIDEVEIFNRALSNQEIAAIHHAGTSGKCHTSTFQFSAPTYTVAENGVNATITVTRTGTHDTAATVDYATVAGGTATADASCAGATDYITTSGTFNFAVNETSKTFTVPICNNGVFEPAETVNLQLSNATGAGASVGTPATAVLTITNDDCYEPPANLVAWHAADGNFNDIQGPTFETGTNVNGVNFVAGKIGQAYNLNGVNQYVSLGNPAALKLTGSITIDAWVNPNDFAEGQLREIVSKWGQNFSTCGTATSDSFLFALTKVGGVIMPQIYIHQSNLGEPSLRAGSTPAGVFSHVATTYNAGTGFFALYVNGVEVASTTLAPLALCTSDKDVLIGAEAVGPQRFFTGVIDEVQIFNRALTAAEINDIYTAGSFGKCKHGLIQFSAPTYSVGEAGPTASITVRRTDGSVGAVSAQFDASNGTATAGSDYTAVSAFIVNWADGDTADKTVTIPIGPDDSIYEGNETVNLALTNATGGAQIGPQGTALLTITENDAAPSFAIDDVSQAEGDTGTTNYVFTVTKTGSTAISASVNFETQDGTATTADNDYSSTSGTLNFASNEDTKTITVAVTGDTKFENTETFTVHLSSPVNATITDADGTGTITNDDVVPTIEFAAANYSESEGNPMMTITVNKIGGTALPASVNYATSPGTATAPADYTETSGTLVFASGETSKTFDVPITPDSVYEADEQFNLALSMPVGATLGPQSTATGTVVNDDNPPASLVVNKVADTDDGFCSPTDCSLREAIDAANFNADANTITFSLSGGGPHVISLTLGELAITENVTITGLGADVLAVQRDAGAAAFRIFFIDTGNTVTISGLAISNGRAAGSYPAGSGAGIFNRGELALTSVTVSDNISDLHGAGLYIEGGPVNVANSTFNNNQVLPGSTQVGGGLMMSTASSVTVTNSTFSNNSAPSGGGLMNNAGTLTITNSTIVNNAATNSAANGGGGIRTDGGTTTNLGNTIVANNTSASLGPDLLFTFNSQGYNLIENTSDATINETANPGTNITGQDPVLGALQDNGGPTFTHAPDSGSPVIDKGRDLSATGEDQRGSTRPVRYLNTIPPAAGGDFSDIGAVELAAPGPCTPPPSGMVGWWPGDGNAIDVQSGNNGTLQDGATFASGQVAQAFQFDGVDAVVTIPNDAAYDFGTNDFTIDTWVNFTAVAPANAFVAHDEGGGTTNKWIFWLSGSNLGFHINTPAGGGPSIGVPFTPVVGQWYHVAVTKSGGDTYKFYVDGIQIGLDQIDSTAVPVVSAPLTLGRAELNVALNGRLDEVEIFNRALSPAELSAIYGAGAAGKCKPCTPPPANMVSWWAGDGHPNDIQDGNHGTLVGGATYGPGMVGQAFSFDGVDDRVAFTAAANLAIGGTGLTMDGWIYPQSNVNGAMLFGRSALSDHPYLLQLIDDGSGNLVVRVFLRTSSGPLEMNTTFAPPVQTWTHLAMVYNGSTLKLYANGAEVFSVAKTGNLDNPISPPFGIGNRSTNPVTSFHGLIDEVEIFNRALNPDEVQRIYAANSSGKCKPPPVVQFSAATYPVSEGVGNAILTVTRTGDSSGTSTVQYATAPGSAAAGDDYTTTTGTLTFGPGVISQPISVPINNDALDENDEDFTVSLSSPSMGTTIGSPGSATVTITDNDAPPTLSMNDAPAVTEGGDATFTVTQSAVSGLATSFKYSTSDGTAMAPGDYTSATDVLVTIPAGETSAMFSITISDDNLYEGGDETFTVTLSDPTNATIADGTGTGTIQDNDAAPVFTIDDVTQTETDAGTTDFTFTVTKSGATQLSSSVKYQTADGTAVAPGDYTAVALTTLTFAPGDTSMQVTVSVNGDTTIEPDETFKVQLSDPVNATIGDSEGIGTITNDDTDVSVMVSPSSVAENSGTDLVYTFTRNPLTSGPITVNFSVGGTADFNTDYTQTGAASFTSTSGTVVIPGGSTTATVTIHPSGDMTVEPDESVVLTVTSGTGYNVGSPAAATGTIANDDTDVSVAVTPASVLEDGTDNLVYTFTRTGVTSGSITVDFSVGGTASFTNGDYSQMGADSFSATSGSITLGDGVTMAIDNGRSDRGHDLRGERDRDPDRDFRHRL